MRRKCLGAGSEPGCIQGLAVSALPTCFRGSGQRWDQLRKEEASELAQGRRQSLPTAPPTPTQGLDSFLISVWLLPLTPLYHHLFFSCGKNNHLNLQS